MTAFASVVVTAWREPAARMERLLETLAAQHDVPGGLEVLVARDPDDPVTPADFSARGSIHGIRLVENPGGARSAGLNRAIRAASSPWVCRVDARSVVGPDYVSRCVALLRDQPRAGVVGGVQVPVASTGGARAAGVARALANPWALGGATYRTAQSSGPTDTVYLGAYRRDEVLTLGGYDERLSANEDFDLCQRYRATGKDVWLDAGLRVPYEARSTLGAVWRQYVAFGRSKVAYWRLTGTRPNRRQAVALGAAAAVAVAVPTVLVRRPERVWAAAGLALLGAVALDAAHPDREFRPRVRAAALPAYAAVVGGWLGGVAAELLRPGARRPETAPSPMAVTDGSCEALRASA